MDAKAKWIAACLEKHFPHPDIPLQHKDPYTLLVAVLLSAQCTDARVNQITPKLFAKASTPRELVLLSIEEIEEIIRPCGLGPTKAKAIWNLSSKLLKQHKGRVPRSLRSLEALPGVGHKTASVVLIQAFQKDAFPVDTHIHRCAKRWSLSSGKSVEQTEKDLKKLFPKKLWKKLHLQMIYYARSFCPAKGHKLEKCPICHFMSEKPTQH